MNPSAAPRPYVVFRCDSQSLDGAATAELTEGQVVGDANADSEIVVLMVTEGQVVGDANADSEMVVLMVTVGSIADPAGRYRMPLLVEQQLRAAWSWPQQKEPTTSQGVNTASVVRKFPAGTKGLGLATESVGCRRRSRGKQRGHIPVVHIWGHSELLKVWSVHPRRTRAFNPVAKQRPLVMQTSALRQQGDTAADALQGTRPPPGMPSG
jgi:hypothetical protein